MRVHVDITAVLFLIIGKMLTQLDVSQNSLGTVPSMSLRNLHHLLILNMNHNRISSLHARAFDGLDTLEILTLYENKISNVDPAAFQGLEKWVTNTYSLYRECYVLLVSNSTPPSTMTVSLWVYITASRFLYNVGSSFLFLFVSHHSTHSTVVVFVNVFVFVDVSIVYSRCFPSTSSYGNLYLLVK